MYQAIAAGATAAISLYASTEKIKAKQRQLMADAALAQQSRTIGGNREIQAFMQNTQAMKDQNTADNLTISMNEAEARDNLLMATAGSGISGASVNELNTEISRSVGADRVAAKRNMANQRDAMNQNRIQNSENRVREAELAQAYDARDDNAGAFLESIGKGMSVMGGGGMGG